MGTMGLPTPPEEQAREVAYQLTQDLSRFNDLEFSRPFETRYSLLADVELALEELRYVLVLANQFGNGVPCLRDKEDTIPIVALPTIFGLTISPALLRRFPAYFPNFFYPPFPETYKVYGNLFASLIPADIVWFNSYEVPKLILSPLEKFLTVRFQWLSDNPQFRSLGAAASPKTNNPYLPFTVHTKTHGLRIHYSKTFVISFNNVFGAPTTPLSGWILPGIHKFCGMDSSGKFYYDAGTFTTPPDFSATLMI